MIIQKRGKIEDQFNSPYNGDYNKRDDSNRRSDAQLKMLNQRVNSQRSNSPNFKAPKGLLNVQENVHSDFRFMTMKAKQGGLSQAQNTAPYVNQLKANILSVDNQVDNDVPITAASGIIPIRQILDKNPRTRPLTSGNFATKRTNLM